MRKIVIPVLLAMMITFAGCTVSINGKDVVLNNWHVGGEEISKSETVSHVVTTQKKFEVKNTVGEVSIEPTDANSLEVQAVKKIRFSREKEKAQRLLDDIKIVLDNDPEKISVNVKYVDNVLGLANQSVDLKIKIPKGMSYISGNITSGELIVNNFGDLEELVLLSSSGSVNVRNCSVKNYQMEISSGEINGENISGNGRIEATSGDMNLNNIKGDLIYGATSGSLEIDNFEGKIHSSISSGELKLTNAFLKASSSLSATSGEIYVEASEIDESGRYTVKASSGEIRLYLPREAGFDLMAKTSSGIIRNDFTVDNVNSDEHRKEIKGKVNGGGPIIDIQMLSGEIAIRKK